MIAAKIIGLSGAVCVYDRRSTEVVKIFEGPAGTGTGEEAKLRIIITHDLIFIDRKASAIECVKWSPDGQLIGVAGSTTPVVAFDFKTGKMLYKGKDTGISLFTESGNSLFVCYFTINT